ncbi:damage-control phosphatase ARMT1 family protein [Reinekea marinisedimentorum]|uniref:Damage-control phosphatase ARMT1-like metal-binding domain-containing protein n=1 Tax=Reinekea marinisedimentorum TaxID=230495 RepID=A0A4R3I6E3_9GAMM|nr:ARMT1-like domain-containing protein [Reinekea marinisedimentorum]TCS40373.1 hypothetical protein BCF53_10982 [Reinekea marinisedimentorum]
MTAHSTVTAIAPACQVCVRNQAQSAARFARLNKQQTEHVMAVVAQQIEQSRTKPIIVQNIVRTVADAIINELCAAEDFDIYGSVKELSNKIACQYINTFKKQIEQSDSPLEKAIQIAAAGNIIDFGAKSHGEIDIEKELENLNKTGFNRYDINPFRAALERAKSLLYICDNSGEIVCDMLFITQLKKQYPRLTITAAVREKPIINDATMQDARSIGLTDVVSVISSGSIYPGTILNETCSEFKSLYKSSDVVLSKGQGNYETLLPTSDKRLFFLLRIKCEAMAALSSVEIGSLVLLQG